MIIVQEAFSCKNVYEAYLKARRGKRHRVETIKFEINALENVYLIAYQLQKKIYQTKGYEVFKVYEPKERIIMAPPFADRVVQHCLCDNILAPRLTKHFIYDTYACLKGKGTHAGLNRLREFLQRYYRKYGLNGWVLKGDIKKFFYSINHEFLKASLYPLLKDDDIYWLTDQIIDSTPNPGLPLGNQSSQWFANFYLSGFDHFVKEKLRVKLYIRYMDDFVLILPTKKEAKQCLITIEQYLWEHLRLETNQKTQIFPIKNGVDFLGFHTYVSGTGKVIRKLRRNSKQRMRRKLKKFKEFYLTGEMSAKDIERSFQSWKGHAQHGNCYRLIETMEGVYDDIFRR